MQYRYISGDSHLEIDSKHWLGRVPAKYRDQAPRLVRQADGSDMWMIGDKIKRAAAAADLYGGKGRDAYVPFDGRYEGTPGTGSPEQRIGEQERDGIDAEVLFPSQQGGPKFWRRVEDNDAYKALVRAYNGWLAEEYCAVNSQRLLGVGILPLGCQLNDVIDELEYCSKAGFKTVLLQGFPSGNAYPCEADDRFWARTLELNMPVSVHVDLDRTGERKEPLFKYPIESAEIMKKLTHDLVDQVGRFGPMRGNGSIAAVQWVLSGLFDRLPNASRVLRRESDRLDSIFPARRRRALRPPSPLGRAAAGLQTAQAAAQRIYPRILLLGLSVRPRRRRAARQDQRRPLDVGLRLPPSRVRLARLAQDHRQKLRRCAGGGQT